MTEEADFRKANGLDNCIYTCYENERLQELKRELESSLTVGETIECEAEKQVFQGVIQTKIIGAKEIIEKCSQDVPSCEEFHQSIQDVTTCCKDILMIIQGLQLPIVKPRWCDLTDAGPGVGMSSFEVKFRDAEMCRMFNSDYRIRLQIKRGQWTG